MAKKSAEKIPVAMEPEQDHTACEVCETCGGLSGYIEQVQSALADLGAPNPEDLIARNNRYVRGARKAGMSPPNAAGMIIGLSGAPDPTSYTPRYQLEETRAEDYVAVDSRGKQVFGPTTDYMAARMHAERSGGVVKFVVAQEPARAEAPKDEKFEDCVQHVKTNSPDANPWAVCHAAIGKEPEPYDNKNVYWHRDGAGYYTDVDPYGRIRVKQRTQDKRAGKLAWFAVVKKVEVVQGETRAEVNESVEKHLRSPRAEVAAGEGCVRLVQQGDVDVIERHPACAPVGIPMGSPKDVAAYMKDRAARLGHEQLFVIGVSKQEELVGQPVVISSGQTAGVKTAISQVLTAAAQLTEAGATSVWLVHPHPSGHGDTPSPADRDLTKRVKKTLGDADIDFKGHVVVSHTGKWARA